MLLNKEKESRVKFNPGLGVISAFEQLGPDLHCNDSTNLLSILFIVNTV